MIVDDEITFREYLRETVDWQSYGIHQVCEAYDGQAALEMARAHAPDLVIADIEMPRLDGLQCAEHIKALCPNCEIVLITGHEKFEYARLALRLGITDFLLKPVSAHEVGQAVQAAAGNLRHRQGQRYSHYMEESLVQQDKYARANGGIVYQGEGGAPGRLEYPAHVRAQVSEYLDGKGSQEAEALLRAYYEDMVRTGVPRLSVCSITLGLFTLCVEALSKHGAAPHQVYGQGFSPFENLNGADIPTMCEWLLCILRQTAGTIQCLADSRRHKLVEQAKQRILESYPDHAFSVGLLAGELFVNEAHLRRLFKQHGEISPGAYLKQVRMEAALQLLQAGGHTVAQTAEAVGFCDTSYFSRCFKQYYGCAPSVLEQ